ncbi:MAG: transporter substrate-binding domain-containing protein [Firmicutes bacterium]|nr:transporter substrate-binding domain-containing protein [Bacillota bacterium]
MKRILAILCAIALTTLLFAGCTAKADPDPIDSTTDEQRAELQLIVPGTLTVGTEIGYPPFEMFADDGVTPIGLDIDLAKEIGTVLGLNVVFQNTDFEGILDGLGINKYDVVMSAVTITPERGQKVDFSNPYIENWQAIVVRKGETPITAPEQLDGKNVAYQKATTSTMFLNKLRETGAVDCKVNEYEKVMDCFGDLKNKRVDCVLCDSVVADDYVANEPELFEITWVQSFADGDEPELFGISVKKGNADLLAAVNDALAQLKADGRYDEICLDWGLDKSRVN